MSNVQVPDSKVFFTRRVLISHLIYTSNPQFKSIHDFPPSGDFYIEIAAKGLDTVNSETVTESIKERYRGVDEISKIEYEEFTCDYSGEHFVIPHTAFNALEVALSNITERVNYESYSGDVDESPEMENSRIRHRAIHGWADDVRVSEYDLYIQQLKTVTARLISQAENLRDHQCDYPAWEDLGDRASICRICGRNGDI